MHTYRYYECVCGSVLALRHPISRKNNPTRRKKEKTHGDAPEGSWAEMARASGRRLIQLLAALLRRRTGISFFLFFMGVRARLGWRCGGVCVGRVRRCPLCACDVCVCVRVLLVCVGLVQLLGEHIYADMYTSVYVYVLFIYVYVSHIDVCVCVCVFARARLYVCNYT